ncbi:MAG TPA: hypothetical protein VD736_00120 [Nitrososphaera sp.]|nr:hypothetical protein [Nitrososphaera sp.]
MTKLLPTNSGRMVKTCSTKCPVCQRLIADSNIDSLVARVKRHARLRHQKDLKDADIQLHDLSHITKVFGSGTVQSYAGEVNEHNQQAARQRRESHR